MESQWILGSVFIDRKYRIVHLLFPALLLFYSRENVIWKSSTCGQDLKQFFLSLKLFETLTKRFTSVFLAAGGYLKTPARSQDDKRRDPY